MDPNPTAAIQPSKKQLDAGMVKVRQILDNYSEFDSRLVTDELLRSIVTDAAVAILNAT